MRMSYRIATAFSAMALIAGGLTVSATGPAQAASCTVSNLGWWSVKNDTCSSARHFNIVSNTTYKYAPWVGKNRTSSQSVCWAYATHYGFQANI